jgi:outer membrane protein
MKKLLVALLVLISTGAMAQQKLGHVNSQVLLDTMPSRKAAIKTMQDFEKDGIMELQEMQKSLQLAAEAFEAKRATLTPLMIQIEEGKLQKKDQELQERQEALQYEIEALAESLNKPILERIKQAVKIVAERKKINYVVDETTTLYFDSGINLTPEVIVELLRLDAEATKQ